MTFLASGDFGRSGQFFCICKMENRICTDEIGLKILHDLRPGEELEVVCRRHGMTREAFYRWRRIYKERERIKDRLQAFRR